jgi:hypothetical protein
MIRPAGCLLCERRHPPAWLLRVCLLSKAAWRPALRTQKGVAITIRAKSVERLGMQSRPRSAVSLPSRTDLLPTHGRNAIPVSSEHCPQVQLRHRLLRRPIGVRMCLTTPSDAARSHESGGPGYPKAGVVSKKWRRATCRIRSRDVGGVGANDPPRLIGEVACIRHTGDEIRRIIRKANSPPRVNCTRSCRERSKPTSSLKGVGALVLPL